MPEMSMRFKKAEDRERALDMVGKARKKAAENFGKEVVWEVRQFGETDGQPDFLINIWVTDNDDQLLDVALKVQTDVLSLMAYLVYEDETVECWVQRVKGKWGHMRGTISRS